MSNGNINDLELRKFMELAGEAGVRVFLLHADGWLPQVADVAALPASGNTLGDIRQVLDTGIPYRWDGSSWGPWSSSGASWGAIGGTLSSQTDLITALNAKMGAGAYVLVSQNSALANQVNLGALSSGLLMSNVSGGVSTITIITNNSTNWNNAYSHSQQTTGNPHNVTKAEVGLGNVDNTSDVNKPVSTAQAAADTAALNAAKAYADGLVVGLLDDRGNYNASSNVFPSSGGSGTAGAILKGDLWTVSVAGTLGGVAVTPGDIVRAIVDTPGQTSTNWAIAETNIGFTPENSTNKSTTMTGNEASNTLYLTAKAIYDWATGLFVQKNVAITGATKTKVTYDAKGLVTAGADATTADIADSADKRYVTDAEKTKLANTSGTNSGNETTSTVGVLINGSTDQPTPVDTDLFALSISSTLRKLTFANLKAAIKSYYDAVTATLTNKDISSATNTYRVASETVTGVLEIATVAEVTEGTDNGRAISPDGMAGSIIFGRKTVQVYVVDANTDISIGDGKAYFVVPQSVNGMNLVRVHARVITAGTTGTTDIQIANVTDSVDMLSTKLTIDSAETGSDTAASAAVINGATDDVVTNDLLRIDIDAASTTKPKGLIVTLEFQLP